MKDHNRSPQETSAMEAVSDWDMLNQEQQSQTETMEAIMDPELFSIKQQQAVMESIIAPTELPGGFGRVMNELGAKHELRILAEMSGAGFDNWGNLDTRDLRTFVSRYPSPANFEEVGNDFIAMIGRANGADKQSQYQQAMTSFKHKVYGERQTYWEQMQAVNALREQVTSGQDIHDVYSAVPEQHQVERSAEWTPGVSSVSQVSRLQVQQGLDPNDTNEFQSDQTCQDAFLVREDEGLFAVFDGAGGHSGGREASRAAATSIDQSCNKYNLKSGSDLAYILNAANQPVRDATNGEGYTTATLAKIIDRDDQKMLAYASVGDSRLYIVHDDGSTELVTYDEGEGNRITNALGIVGDKRTKQYGEIAITSGDKVVLCTDGITGDYGDDLMGESELASLVMRSQTPEAAAANLVAAARKTDDRTALVFAV